MSRKSTAKTIGFGIAAFLLFAVLLTVEIWIQPPLFLGPIKQQATAAFRDTATQRLILAALAGYFILFCVLEQMVAVGECQSLAIRFGHAGVSALPVIKSEQLRFRRIFNLVGRYCFWQVGFNLGSMAKRSSFAECGLVGRSADLSFGWCGVVPAGMGIRIGDDLPLS